MQLSEFLTGHIFGFFLVLARIGTIIVFIPGFGEQFIPPRIKIALALILSAALYPATPVAPNIPDNLVIGFSLLAIEVTIGLWIGVVARGLMTALQYAGHQVGQVSALANAFASNVGSFQGATMVASFLLIAGLALIFVTNTHHIMIEAMLFSYEVMPIGQLPIESMASELAKATSAVMKIGMSMALPFFVLGVLNNLALGLANRMMPTLPVFFVASSTLIAAGLLLFSFSSKAMLEVFLHEFTNWLQTFTM